MKTNRDPQRDDRLIDTVLRDEQWQAADAAFKAQAMGAFQKRQRIRQVTRWVGGTAVLGAALVVALRWTGPSLPPRSPVATAMLAVPVQAVNTRYLTDEELLAVFPQGSCFIAEIDGRKELVFLDPALERQYLSKPRAQAN